MVGAVVSESYIFFIRVPKCLYCLKFPWLIGLLQGLVPFLSLQSSISGQPGVDI